MSRGQNSCAANTAAPRTRPTWIKKSLHLQHRLAAEIHYFSCAKRRTASAHRGYAFVTQNDTVIFASARFHLLHCLLNRHAPSFEGDFRVTNAIVLNHLGKQVQNGLRH